jgi:hypothetical protein
MEKLSTPRPCSVCRESNKEVVRASILRLVRLYICKECALKILGLFSK